jgi:hypothetical protein
MAKYVGKAPTLVVVILLLNAKLWHDSHAFALIKFYKAVDWGIWNTGQRQISVHRLKLTIQLTVFKRIPFWEANVFSAT